MDKTDLDLIRQNIADCMTSLKVLTPYLAPDDVEKAALARSYLRRLGLVAANLSVAQTAIEPLVVQNLVEKLNGQKISPLIASRDGVLDPS